MSPVKRILPWISIAAAAASALTGLYAATVVVRNNTDVFMSDLDKQSHWAAIAAASAGVSVLAQAIDRLMSR